VECLKVRAGERPGMGPISGPHPHWPARPGPSPARTRGVPPSPGPGGPPGGPIRALPQGFKFGSGCERLGPFWRSPRRLFRRERGDDFFKSRVASQRAP
jgi:hypothetical protein